MPHIAAFHQGHHCSSKYLFRGSGHQRVNSNEHKSVFLNIAFTLTFFILKEFFRYVHTISMGKSIFVISGCQSIFL